jgi:hypothetical protein
MRKPIRGLLFVALAGFGVCGVRAAVPALTDVDVGTPSQPGSMTVSNTPAGDKVYTIVGGGNDIWNTSDNFHYAYFKVTGDFDYVVRVRSLEGNAGDGGWCKAELMARLEEYDGAGPQGPDPFIANMTTRPSSDTPPGGSAGVNYRGPQWRVNRNGNADWRAPSPTVPPNMPDNWVRMERIGSTFYMYWSNDGKTWSMYKPYDPQGFNTAGMSPPGADSASAFPGYNDPVIQELAPWPSTIMLGLAVTAHSDPDISTAVFSDFGPWTPVPIEITTQPPATLSVPQNNPFTLSVVATGDPVHYQWRKDGVEITNAISPTYKVTLAKSSDAGTYTVRLYGGGKELISANSVVTVTVDTTPPTILKASGDPTFTRVTVEFSEPVSATAENASNYKFDKGITVSSVTRIDEYKVALTTSKMAEATAYTLTVNGVQDTASPPNTIATDTTVTVNSFTFKTGYVLQKKWENVSPNNIAALTGDPRFPDSPDSITLEPRWEYPPNGGNEAGSNYGNQLIGWFIPDKTGNYIFFTCSDDPSDLYLSTDDNPANKKLIAQETNWSNAREWVIARAGSADSKRSDLFAGSEWPTPNVITLQAGRRYYMESLHTEGGGGDNVGATFIMEGEADPANGDAPKITGALVGTYVDPDALPPIITQSPQDGTVAQNASLTLSVKAESTKPLSYQWYLNGNAVPGATNADLVLTNPTVDQLGQYTVNVSNVNGSILVGPAAVLVTGGAQPFLIEAEDFNYDGGKYNPKKGTAGQDVDVMPYLGGAYAGLSAQQKIDYDSNDGEDSTDYRAVAPSKGGTQNKDMNDNLGGLWGRTRLGAWDVTTNYKLGWVDTADWGNYTRTFPNATYRVFAALSHGDGPSSATALRGKLDLVTAGVTTTNQTLEALGKFVAPGTGGWGRNNLVPMTDNDGNPKTVALSGEKTVRFTMDSGDFDYLLFVPTELAPEAPRFTSITMSADGKITVAWEGGGTLQATTSLTPPIQWQDVTSTSPYTFTPEGSAMFGRIKK